MPRVIAAAVVLGALAACAGRRADVGGAGTEAPASGAFVYHRHQIFVPVVIDGKPAGEGLIDTGANACAVDDDVAARLGLGPGTVTVVHGTAGAVSARTVTLGSIGVLGASVSGVGATVYDLGHGATPSGEPLGLIIGYPFLKHFAVEVDYTARRLTLHTRPVRTDRAVPMPMDNGIRSCTCRSTGDRPRPSASTPARACSTPTSCT